MLCAGGKADERANVAGKENQFNKGSFSPENHLPPHFPNVITICRKELPPHFPISLSKNAFAVCLFFVSWAPGNLEHLREIACFPSLYVLIEANQSSASSLSHSVGGKHSKLVTGRLEFWP